jgi:exodeoxyribonuclease VII large subunit
MTETLLAPQRDIYSVSRLNNEVARLLGGSFPLLWIEGEISNFTQPRSGHMYFSLKDAVSQVRAAMFRNNNMYLRFKPESGMHVLVRARVALYEPRGDFQLIVEHMEEAGDGALQRAFEQLKQKLFVEGLFAEENKLALPGFPRRLGVITSPTGAALRDVLSVLRRRYPRLPVLIYPVAVQGQAAVSDILQALQLAAERADCDVLLLTRGGGSLEDLQAFNNEMVARAIAACPIPVVSGIGHEIDYTIADFVADLRAPTPSVAAELVSPDAIQLTQQLARLSQGLQSAIKRLLTYRRDAVRLLETRIQRLHPQQKLQTRQQQLDELEKRLRRSASLALQRAKDRLGHGNSMLYAHTPLHAVRQSLDDLIQYQNRLKQAADALLQQKRYGLSAVLRSLDTVSPLNTLKRGYAIVTRPDSNQPIVRARDITAGEELDVRLAQGVLNVEVIEK